MFYSNFLKKWVKTCERCNIALINWKTDIENVYIDNQNYWYNKFLKTSKKNRNNKTFISKNLFL